MLKKIFFLFIPISLCAQISDSQVLEYVKYEHAKGTSQEAIGKSLIQREVSQSQLFKIKSQIGQQQKSNIEVGKNSTGFVLRTTPLDGTSRTQGGRLSSYQANRERAEKKRTYIVYMNGMTAKAKDSSEKLIKPSAEIIVPTKEEKVQMTIGQTIGLGSSMIFKTSVITLLINFLTK